MIIINIHYEIELYYGICFHSKSDATKIHMYLILLVVVLEL
jgi:hypothetical protein